MVYTAILLFFIFCLLILICFFFFSSVFSFLSCIFAFEKCEHSFLSDPITFILLLDFSSSYLQGRYFRKIDYNYSGWHLLSDHLVVIYIYNGRHVRSCHLDNWDYIFFLRVIQPSLSPFAFFMNFMASFFVIWLAGNNSWSSSLIFYVIILCPLVFPSPRTIIQLFVAQ